MNKNGLSELNIGAQYQDDKNIQLIKQKLEKSKKLFPEILQTDIIYNKDLISEYNNNIA